MLLVLLCSAKAFVAEKAIQAPTSEPKLVSIFPVGGQRGTTFEAEVTGKQLQGAYAIWFEDEELAATIEQIEDLKKKQESETKVDDYGQQENQPDYRAHVKFRIPPEAALGLHPFRLVTERGVSNALFLQVVSEPIVAETESSHQRANLAQPLTVPVVVNGQLTEKGEQDFYALQVSQGEELVFEVRSDLGRGPPQAEAGITLYNAAGSWFDPRRITRVMVDGPSLSWFPIHRYQRVYETGKFAVFRRFVHRFRSAGRYLVSVNTYVGGGAPHHSYQLRIAPRKSAQISWALGAIAHLDPSDWRERDSASLRQLGSFARPFAPDYLSLLFSRGGPQVGASAETTHHGVSPTLADGLENPNPLASTSLHAVDEVEPNDSFHEAGTASIPALLQGHIQSAGDEDHFRFTVEAGQHLAFEIETPQLAPPQFNPWLKVFDRHGKQLVENIYKEYGGNGIDVNKTLERKTIFTFDQAGDYYVQIRDLTSRKSGGEYQYRLLIRPQIPHLGRTEVSMGAAQFLSTIVEKSDRINLQAGQTQEVVVVSEKEEGFVGDIAFSIENLPTGVRALPSTPALWTKVLMRGVQYRPLDAEVMPPTHHRAERTSTTLRLTAETDATTTNAPRFIQIIAWPVVEGKTGLPVLAGRIPFMLITDGANHEP